MQILFILGAWSWKYNIHSDEDEVRNQYIQRRSSQLNEMHNCKEVKDLIIQVQILKTTIARMKMMMMFLDITIIIFVLAMITMK